MPAIDGFVYGAAGNGQGVVGGQLITTPRPRFAQDMPTGDVQRIVARGAGGTAAINHADGSTRDIHRIAGRVTVFAETACDHRIVQVATVYSDRVVVAADPALAAHDSVEA